MGIHVDPCSGYTGQRSCNRSSHRRSNHESVLRTGSWTSEVRFHPGHEPIVESQEAVVPIEQFAGWEVLELFPVTRGLGPEVVQLVGPEKII